MEIKLKMSNSTIDKKKTNSISKHDFTQNADLSSFAILHSII